jgi:MFS family permease
MSIVAGAAPLDATATAAIPTTEARQRFRRLVFASSLGSAIEHYDFFCYAFIAPIAFGTAFFPKMDPLAGMLAVYTTFAVGFAARPLGGLVFGHYGDKLGRKNVLMLTLFIMGFASFLIGCLPSYASVGIWAPIALVAFRFLQGLALGGEYMNAVCLTMENSPTGKRGFFASFINASGPVGIITASGVIALLSGVAGTDAFQEWVWRIPFILSFVLGLIGTYVRSNVDESPLFRSAQAAKRIPRIPITQVLRTWKKSALMAILVNMVHSSFQYLSTVFVIGYAVKMLGMPASGVTAGTTIANVVEMLMVPLIAMYSDRIGRKPILLAGIVLAAIWFPFFFEIVALRSVPLLICALVVSVGFIHALMFAPEAAFSAELFPTEVRVSGSSLGKQLGVVLGGGLAPLVATALMGKDPSFTPVVLYFEVIAAVAFLGIVFAPDNYRKAL